MKKKFERVLIARNEAEASFTKSCLSNLKSRFEAIEQTLRKYGLPVTDETVCDALRLRLTHVAGEPLQQGNFTNKICVAVEKWLNVDHLDEAFETIKAEMMAKAGDIAMAQEQVISQMAVNRIRCYERLEQYNSFRSRPEDREALLHSVCVNSEGHISIDEAKLDAHLDEVCGIWCNSPEAKEIYDAHKKAADALNKFLNLLNEELDPELLFYKKNGKWFANEFDYNNFVKDKED